MTDPWDDCMFPYIWLIFVVNVGKYTIHGSYGIGMPSKKKRADMTCSMQRNLAPCKKNNGLVTMVELDKPFTLNEGRRCFWFFDLYATGLQRRSMKCSHLNSEPRVFFCIIASLIDAGICAYMLSHY